MASNFPNMGSYGHTDVDSQRQNDPLNLNEYVMPDGRNPRLDALLQAAQSPSSISNSGSSMMSAFPDYNSMGLHGSMNANHGGGNQMMASAPDGVSQGPMGDAAFAGASDAQNAARSQHKLSISSMGGMTANGGLASGASADGMDTETSPQSAFGMGPAGFGDDYSRDDASTNADTGNKENRGDDTPKGRKKDGDPDHPPPWSEMKTKAGKERKRLPLACIACRRKKIRCSGEKPACKHCLRSRIPCVYKVTTRKAAPRTDYMAMLDKRLKRMEERVIKLIPKESMGAVSAVGRAVVKPPLPGAPPKGGPGKKRPAEEAFGAELDEWSKSKATNPNESRGSQPPKGADVENSLLTEGLESLPPKEIQEHLAEVYFDYCYGQSYPLLHKPSFMRRLAAGQVPPVLILAVCAISARFSTHPQIRTEPAFLRGEVWASKARDIALKRYDTPNITILITYLLLGLHEFGTCQGGRSWMFGGMAQRMAYALQLHKDLDHDPLGKENGDRAELSFTDREIRRRTMWSCFLMDRFNSSGTDRPLFVSGQFIKVQLPIREHYFQMEIPGPTEDLEGRVRNPAPADAGQIADAKENMGVVAYLVRSVAIWGRLIMFNNLGGKEKERVPIWSPQSTFQELKREAHEFRASLPERLHYTQENLQNHITEKTANQFIFLHIVYHQIILFLNRFALPSHAGSRPPQDMPHQFLTEAAHAALDAANQISLLVNEAMNYNVVVPFAGYCAFLSSTVHIRGVFSKNPKLEMVSKRYLAYNVKFLSKMKKYWGMFHFVAENLKDLYRQHADAALRGPAAVNGRQTSIFQYGDWFDRYPHGVSRTDYEDPAADVKKEAGTDAVLGQKSDLQSVEEFFASLSPSAKTAEQSKKGSKKSKQSKSQNDGKQASTTSPHPQSGNVHHVQTSSPMDQQHMHLPQQLDPSSSAFDPSAAAAFMQQNPQHAYDFMTGTSDFSSLNHPMSALDRQMVLQSYATFMDRNEPFALDVNAFNASLSQQGQHGQNHNNHPGAGPGASPGFFTDPSAAWFMPFNMDPPTALGDDGGMFGAGPQGYGGFTFDGGAVGGDFGAGMDGLGPLTGEGQGGTQ
ncbi:putative c6 transcription factor protein [Neofusicoccum parvum UCRNP2]|uniref:Putative c6 transcription factor protein n=1 Tax=Botryosphaeria parva (strain UCR-NP2) TaxID=1287680 RepID=R1GLE1_BOTPV|nr:putative c6 transcription factor protein [Neofusicoccum parvum UCRNP2]